jgi:hypothetical protein
MPPKRQTVCRMPCNIQVCTFRMATKPGLTNRLQLTRIENNDIRNFEPPRGNACSHFHFERRRGPAYPGLSIQPVQLDGWESGDGDGLPVFQVRRRHGGR